MKRAVQTLSMKRMGCVAALLAATSAAACKSSAESEAQAAAFRSCLEVARITGTYATQYVYSGGQQSRSVIASETVTQAQADAANTCLLEKGL